jgi:hypothetical protein
MTNSLAEAWQRQIAYCDANQSPFTARVLEAAWADWQAGGALRALLPDWLGDAGADAVPLRVAGALHSLALDGSDAALAALYPPRCEHFDARAAPAAIAAALHTHRDRVAEYLRLPPQTNEIGRSAVLLGGFAAIARATGLPLATFEIGASAGLNQLWHRYRYALGGSLQWGDAASAAVIRSEWRGSVPTLPPHVEVASHAACDVAPLDLAQPGSALRLASYVWPEHRERLDRLQAAVTLAQRLRLKVAAADALAWVEREFAMPRIGIATVLVHSVMWQYMPSPTRTALHEFIAAAGTHASRSAPLAHLAFEPDPRGVFELALTLWPGGQRTVLATAHAHGRWVDWVDGAEAAPTAPGP